MEVPKHIDDVLRKMRETGRQTCIYENGTNVRGTMYDLRKTWEDARDACRSDDDDALGACEAVQVKRRERKGEDVDG